jgi:hypothetical protein
LNLSLHRGLSPDDIPIAGEDIPLCRDIVIRRRRGLHGDNTGSVPCDDLVSARVHGGQRHVGCTVWISRHSVRHSLQMAASLYSGQVLAMTAAGVSG